ncbi:MFS transporter [Pseudonocardia endophytica]|uniref:MFS transporter n=1 Tax=Pseudonocardia endophytica TaxID=401976 RepID=A0A4R1I083_PSEEN|nr:MFS transporter [Pseudonocardia endophytica]TCK25839.1 MFS transporter [Pseudonocardia endophytica]
MSTTSSSPVPSTTGTHRDPGRAALRGGIFGYYADQFDIFVPILTLAPAMIFFQPADMSPTASALVAAAVFASTMVARPLGSAIFGHYADKVGRRITTMVAVAGFGASTFLIAMLPGHQHIGTAAIVLLVGLRFVAGIFLGGEYSTAVPLAMEWSPRHRRGLASGLITATSPAATASIAALSLLLLSTMSSGGLDTAYVQWGWRIPFLFGALLAVGLFVYYRRNVEEAPAFDTDERPSSPLAELLRGRHRRALLQVFVLMTGTWTLTNVGVAVLPATLKKSVGLDDRAVSVVMTIAPLACIGGFLACALLSQRFGRRPFYVGFGVVAAVVASTCFYVLTTLDADDVVLAGVLATAVQVLSLSLFGPIAAYITERFPASIRATGYGVGYSLALVIPAFYAFYLSGLSALVGDALAPVVLIVVGGALVAVGGWLGPETRDVDMTTAA